MDYLPSLAQTRGAKLRAFGKLSEFRAVYHGNKTTVTVIYGGWGGVG